MGVKQEKQDGAHMEYGVMSGLGNVGFYRGRRYKLPTYLLFLADTKAKKKKRTSKRSSKQTRQ